MNRVKCFETGRVFESQAEAARAFGLSPAAISIAKKTGRRAGGVHWHDPDENPNPDLFSGSRPTRPGSIPIVCCETGETFGSIRLAAKSKGIRPATLSAALDGTAGGYHWKRANTDV